MDPVSAIVQINSNILYSGIGTTDILTVDLRDCVKAFNYFHNP